MHGQAGEDDRAPAADVVVGGADDGVGDGLAGDEAEEVAAGLAEDGGPPGLALGEHGHADDAGEEVETHAGHAEARPEREGAEQHHERLERLRHAEGGNGKGDNGAEGGQKGEGGDGGEAEPEAQGGGICAGGGLVGRDKTGRGHAQSV